MCLRRAEGPWYHRNLSREVCKAGWNRHRRCICQYSGIRAQRFGGRTFGLDVLDVASGSSFGARL